MNKKQAINEDNVFSFFIEHKNANFPQIADYFCAVDKKERFNLQSILSEMCEKETLKYSTKTKIYYTKAYYNKIKGIKNSKLKSISLQLD